MQLRKERLKKFRLAKIETLTFEMYVLYMKVNCIFLIFCSVAPVRRAYTVTLLDQEAGRERLLVINV